MKRKTKFMTAILSRDEWQAIKYGMKCYESFLELKELEYKAYRFKNCKVVNPYHTLYLVVKHFNSISVDSIEELADKIERERRKKSRDKPKQKASRNLANEPNS